MNVLGFNKYNGKDYAAGAVYGWSLDQHKQDNVKYHFGTALLSVEWNISGIESALEKQHVNKEHLTLEVLILTNELWGTDLDFIKKFLLRKNSGVNELVLSIKPAVEDQDAAIAKIKEFKHHPDRVPRDEEITLIFNSLIKQLTEKIHAYLHSLEALHDKQLGPIDDPKIFESSTDAKNLREYEVPKYYVSVIGNVVGTIAACWQSLNILTKEDNEYQRKWWLQRKFAFNPKDGRKERLAALYSLIENVQNTVKAISDTPKRSANQDPPWWVGPFLLSASRASLYRPGTRHMLTAIASSVNKTLKDAEDTYVENTKGLYSERDRKELRCIRRIHATSVQRIITDIYTSMKIDDTEAAEKYYRTRRLYAIGSALFSLCAVVGGTSALFSLPGLALALAPTFVPEQSDTSSVSNQTNGTKSSESSEGAAQRVGGTSNSAHMDGAGLSARINDGSKYHIRSNFSGLNVSTTTKTSLLYDIGSTSLSLGIAAVSLVNSINTLHGAWQLYNQPSSSYINALETYLKIHAQYLTMNPPFVVS